MSFNWEKFVVLAEKLHTQKSEECYRTAISRAYYGVFCILRDLKGYDKYTKGDVHSKIIEVYKKSNDSREKWIGKILDDLRNMRNTADYNGEEIISETTSQKSILKAKEILINLNIK